jgi:hypothetical protein
VWAVFGFTYPSAPISYACNATSKILAFAVAISLFASKEPAELSPVELSGKSKEGRESVPSSSVQA